MKVIGACFAVLVVLVACLFGIGIPAFSQAPRNRPDPQLVAARDAMEKKLESIAVIDRKVMVAMRDGKKMAADIYRPKDPSGKYPGVFVRTPYNFNYWDVANGIPADMSRQIEAVQRGYAYVEMQERGHFFSQGNYDILGPPRTDGSDEIQWISSQPWSNGNVGTTGCSSTAEWQLGVVAENDPGLKTFNVQGFGAGVGRVGPYYEQGNWYRGGAVQMLFIDWLYGEQNQVRPMFSDDATQEELIRASKAFDLAAHFPDVDWSTALWHLPEIDIIKAVDGPHGIFADHMPVETGGAMIERTPNDPAWYKGGLWNDSMPISKPGLWFMSWYDVSVSPNLAAYNFVRHNAAAAVADNQYAIIAPVLHCAYTRATEQTMIGDLDVGDARLDYDDIMYSWFDHFLKGENNSVTEQLPKVLYYVVGEDRWESSNTWPPEGARPKTFYLHSEGGANTLYGNGALAENPDATDHPDRFTYDPGNPVQTFGGGGCCEGEAVHFGSFDQRPVEARNDVLVYTTPAFTGGTEMSGPITVTLYVSSSAKDTDFTFRIDDVYPDGRAFNLIENIQRMRYRDGYDKAPAWMQPGQVYKVTFQPIDFSNFFFPGHKLRLEISSSNFPRFDRNLNTGGNNYAETDYVVAHNAVHHSSEYPSKITISVVPNPHPWTFTEKSLVQK
jgi:uncharacterized protein